MPGAGLTDAEVKAVFAPATTPTREAPALSAGLQRAVLRCLCMEVSKDLESDFYGAS